MLLNRNQEVGKQSELLARKVSESPSPQKVLQLLWFARKNKMVRFCFLGGQPPAARGLECNPWSWHKLGLFYLMGSGKKILTHSLLGFLLYFCFSLCFFPMFFLLYTFFLLQLYTPTKFQAV